MVYLTTANLFHLASDAKVNTVNCVGIMGKGVAWTFKEHFPDLFEAYRDRCVKELIAPGDVWTWVSRENLTVFNLATKQDWRNPSCYEWIVTGLKNLRIQIEASKCSIVAMPLPGCGNGGLSPDIVIPLVTYYLRGMKATIYVCH